MKNQQGAPEALRQIARYKIGYATDGWGMRSSTPSGIPDHAGAWVRYEDHVAALVEAQQPAPSAAAPVGEAPLPLLVRDIAADLGTTPIQVCTALAQLGFGGHSVNMAVTPRMAKSLRAHFASPTPQADSQPAPVRDERAAFEAQFPAPSGVHWNGDEYIVKDSYINSYRCDRFIGQWEAWQARAARPPADSVTAPAGPSKLLPYEPTSAMLIAARERDPALPIETVRAIYWSMWRTAPTPPAQAADSVLEDAAHEAIAKVLAMFPFNVPIQMFTIGGGPHLTADGDTEFYSVKRVLAFLTEIKTTLDAARKQGGAT
ncbi:hypothetical protein [Acidovorax sp.]|uniref:hypothetical protein n=1 Tax=Acidovorax sp. TaxID=1872122 RepID=UPI0031D2C383